jgi:hypothetical protein
MEPSPPAPEGLTDGDSIAPALGPELVGGPAVDSGDAGLLSSVVPGEVTADSGGADGDVAVPIGRPVDTGFVDAFAVAAAVGADVGRVVATGVGGGGLGVGGDPSVNVADVLAGPVTVIAQTRP